MKTFFALLCSIALACVVAGAQEEKKKEQPKKKVAPAGQVSQPAGPTGKAGGKPVEAGKPTGTGKPAEVGKAKGPAKPDAGRPTEVGKAKGASKPTTAGKPAEVSKPKGAGKPTETGKAAEASKPTEAGKPPAGGKPGAAGVAAAKPFKPQKFNLPNKPKPEVAPAVTFQQNRRIEGSQNWQGSNYQVFRNYKSEWHDRNWWHSHSNNVVFIFGGWYAMSGGYWYPAWGYDPNAYYAYDGPIYAYNNLPPDQVIANVQAALQQQGYYHGEVDGLLGPLTREAVASYQRDHGLYETSSIDQPTLESLGMA